jgi:hypothetical protein
MPQSDVFREIPYSPGWERFVREVDGGSHENGEHPHQVGYFWLCGSCCRTMTVVTEKGWTSEPCHYRPRPARLPEKPLSAGELHQDRSREWSTQRKLQSQRIACSRRPWFSARSSRRAPGRIEAAETIMAFVVHANQRQRKDSRPSRRQEFLIVDHPSICFEGVLTSLFIPDQSSPSIVRAISME